MKIIGITGGIGSGKSTISQFLRIEGYPVYDCDTNAKNITDTNQNIKNKLIETFGCNIYDSNGLLNKKLLASIIFSSEEKRLLVNSIIHPEVLNDVRTWIMNQDNKIIFIESALLFDSGLNILVDKTIFVDADENIRLKRAIKREIHKRGLTEDVDNIIAKDIASRIQSQKAQYQYAKEHSNYIIENNNNLIICYLLNLLNELV